MRESSGVSANLTALPSGGAGGTLGDRFQPDLVKGTGNYQVPLHFPYGPNELKPSLALTYSTGYGNGVFGLGWRLNPLRIERRTDRGVPRYDPSDEFVLADTGVLVPVGGGRYRPTADTSGWLIRQVGEHWEIRDGTGHTLRLGLTPGGREIDPDSGATFGWCVEEETDPAGNTVSYHWSRDGGVLYLDEIRYSIFRIRVRYQARPDLLRDGRAGFLRTTRRRAHAIEVRCQRPTPTVLRRYDLDYRLAHNRVSLLASVTLRAERDGEHASMPPLRFDYSALDPDHWAVSEPTAAIRPPSIRGAGVQFVDLTGDGLPDLLAMSGGQAHRWENRGGGEFAGPFRLDGLPSTVSLERGNVGFADLDGNGRVDLFAADQPLQLAFRADARGGFDPAPVVFESVPTVGLARRQTRLVDTDGDGVVDLYATETGHHLWYRHVAGRGFTEPVAIPRLNDLAEFPDVSFANPGVHVADMTGDGLTDIVEVRSGFVAYWPSLGHGRWGRRVVMATPPVLPDGFRPGRLHLADLDGSGCADVVYVDGSRVLVWFNQSGNGFTEPVAIPVGVPGDGAVELADVYGDGRPALVWATAPVDPRGTGFHALRFAPGVAPYLMAAVDNGMGGRFEMAYRTSTDMRRLDAADGRVWAGELPIVLPLLASITELDSVTGRCSERRFRYHDGVFDGPDRDFRGFAEVTVTSPGDDSVPGNRQEVTHFVGDPHHVDPAERDRQRALVGAVLATRTYTEVSGGWRLTRSSQQSWDVRVEHQSGTGRVYFPHLDAIETTELGIADPDLIDRVEFSDYDAHGNPGRRVRASRRADQPPAAAIRSEERWTYTGNETVWLVKLPTRLEYREGDGTLHAVQLRRYDGPPHRGLPADEVTAGLLTRVLELRLLDSKLPAGFGDGRDLTELGFVRAGSGETAGWYSATFSVRRAPNGNVVEQRNPLGEPVMIDFDADGVFPVTTTGPNGQSTATTFEPRSGEPAVTVFPDGRQVVHEYDPLGRLVATRETVDAAGTLELTQCWILDQSGPLSLTSVAPRTGGRSRADFAAADLETVTGASVSRLYYDGFGQEAVQVTTGPDGPGGERRFVVTGQARVNPLGLASTQYPHQFAAGLGFGPQPDPDPPGVARTTFDADGRIVDTLGSAGERFHTARDTLTVRLYEGANAGPFPATATEASPPPGAPSRVETYDARGRNTAIAERTAPNRLVETGFTLTVDGRISAVTDDRGTVASYVFAGPGDPIAVSHRDVGTRSYLYDAADRLVERTESDGTRIRFGYDALGRTVRIEHDPGGGAPTELLRTLHYDTDPSAPDDDRFLVGRLAVVEEGDTTIRFAYTPGGRCRREEYTLAGQTLALARDYDLQGSLTTQHYPDGHAVDYELDDSGSITAIPGFASGVRRDARGAVLGYALANGVVIELARNPITDRLEEISASRDGTVLRRLRYQLNDLGRIDGVEDTTDENVEQQVYGYDGRFRLTSFARFDGGTGGPLVQSGTYQLDDLGNIQRIAEGQPLELRYADPLRPGRVTGVQPTGGPAVPVLYNGRGHIRRFGRLTEIGYDPLDRAVRFVRNDGTEIRIRYDHENRRIAKEVERAGQTTVVRYVTGIFEQYATHALRHVYLGRTLIATERVEPAPVGTSRVYYLADRQGTPICATDETGAVVSNTRLAPFGGSWSGPGGGLDGELHRFLGRIRDEETGLVHLGSRYYSPDLGRFISADWYPLENPTKAALLPQAYHVYAYALNNPLSFKDPSGLFVFLIAGAVLAGILVGALIATGVAFGVGFVAGLIYGLSNGQGWGSLMTALETALLTTVGMWLGAVTGALAGFAIGGPTGAIIGAIVGGAMGGMNGLISGMTGIYDWSSWKGWAAFLSDSTWGLVGTSLGNMVHVANLFWPDTRYRYDLSHRQNRHVYEGGVKIRDRSAFAQGNVISNAEKTGTTVDVSFLNNHEMLHVWQGRIFGPLFQVTYVVWAIGGLIVGTAVWLTDTDQDWGSLVETAAYYDNPFEYWAYKNDHKWPPARANPTLTW